MTKKEFQTGIEEYKQSNLKKSHSSKTKELHSQFIQPILEKTSEIYKKEKKTAAWSGSFFQEERILARVGIRENSLYREEEKYYEIDEIIDILVK